MPISFELTPEMMREIIMDHYSSPRHKEDPKVDGCLSIHSSSVNCIDDINVYLKLDDKGVVTYACWNGVACAISTSSSDILCDLLIGKTVDEANYLIKQFNSMIHEEDYDDMVLEEALAFKNTSKQAARIHCATIGWDAVKQLLEEGK